MPKQAPLILDASSIQALQILSSLGGSITDKEGRLTPRLTEQYPQLKKSPSHAPSQTFKALEEYGLITREMHGRRTFKLELTDAGFNAATKLAPLFTNGNNNEAVSFEDIDNDALLSELAHRLAHEDHSECEQALANRDATILELNNTLQNISDTMVELNDGKITWVQAIQMIANAAQPSL